MTSVALGDSGATVVDPVSVVAARAALVVGFRNNLSSGNGEQGRDIWNSRVGGPGKTASG